MIKDLNSEYKGSSDVLWANWLLLNEEAKRLGVVTDKGSGNSEWELSALRAVKLPSGKNVFALKDFVSDVPSWSGRLLMGFVFALPLLVVGWVIAQVFWLAARLSRALTTEGEYSINLDKVPYERRRWENIASEQSQRDEITPARGPAGD